MAAIFVIKLFVVVSVVVVVVVVVEVVVLQVGVVGWLFSGCCVHRRTGRGSGGS